MTALIVHGGAGVHSVSSESEVKAALLAACSRASTSTSALDAVENAIAFLEDATVFNAGCGSNLTLQGTVEGDAAIMDGLTGDFASVGAVSGIKNPISLARCILEHSRTPDPLGRVPPLTLVSMGAQAFARQSAPHLLVPPESMITQRTQKQWETWKDRLAAASDGADMIQDTVGAVAWHEASGEIASGVSSGGILLKYPGRIGEAAVFGAGCWAQAATRGRRMACSVSGRTGEYIIKTSLARSFSAAFNDGTQDPDVHAIIERVLVDEFWIPTRSASNPDPSAGVILLTTEQDDEARLWCGFTTSSFAIAYSSRSRAKAYVLRRPKAIESRPNDHPRVFVTAFAL
ncbi:asparaginase [Mycena amicta]|nr:asparaginase [Mycena amicta]